MAASSQIIQPARTPVNKFHPVDHFVAYTGSVTTTAIGHEVGYYFYPTKAGVVCTGVRFYWGTAGDSVNAHLWTDGVLTSTKAVTTVGTNAANTATFTSPVLLTAGTRYCVSVSNGTKYHWSATGKGIKGVLNAFFSPDYATAGASERYVLSGDIAYTWCVYASGGANTYPDTSLAEAAGIVAVEAVIA